MDKKQNIDIIVWSPPKTGNIKVNFDGASRCNPGKSGYGAIIRDEFGNFIGENFGPLGINTNNMAKMAGLLARMEWFVVRGFWDIEVEGGCIEDKRYGISYAMTAHSIRGLSLQRISFYGS
ncbi:uncharacterized protein LOC131858291 [Cryptomeria japonica]|uniref:uncharacterized protein LOC131858291 n=1 Tax=Cryptomeria japonica TaxID=3369 RepID=UPI0027DA81A8|nr:uncharacterized protein LOC131858291 [Cryptomeria japonica]